jgi:hypothetical protein
LNGYGDTALTVLGKITLFHQSNNILQMLDFLFKIGYFFYCSHAGAWEPEKIKNHANQKGPKKSPKGAIAPFGIPQLQLQRQLPLRKGKKHKG